MPQPDGKLLDWTTFLTVIGQFPLEFFSTRTVLTDNEGLASSAGLIEALGRQDLQDVLSEFLTSLFTVKALPSQMPKFGAQADQVLIGICNMILILTYKYEEPVVFWLKQLMEPCLDALRQTLSSTYLANKLVEAKIHSFIVLVSRLYEYGSDKLRQSLR